MLHKLETGDSVMLALRHERSLAAGGGRHRPCRSCRRGREVTASERSRARLRAPQADRGLGHVTRRRRGLIRGAGLLSGAW
jgi:hypothetical protein